MIHVLLDTSITERDQAVKDFSEVAVDEIDSLKSSTKGRCSNGEGLRF